MSRDYIAALQDAIQHTHGCASRYAETVPVREEFNGQAVWVGDVEVFDLIDHPKARQCYAWGVTDDTGRWKYVAVLKVPPVDTSLKAVHAYILSRPEE
jgi:hypothetical protein